MVGIKSIPWRGILAVVVLMAAVLFGGWLVFSQLNTKIAELRQDNRALSAAVEAHRVALDAANTAHNKRNSGRQAVEKDYEENRAALDLALHRSTDWASTPVPSDVARVLKQPLGTSGGPAP